MAKRQEGILRQIRDEAKPQLRGFPRELKRVAHTETPRLRPRVIARFFDELCRRRRDCSLAVNNFRRE